MEHVVVYYEKDRYAGWPANNGIWSWGDEIVVGFQAAHMDITASGKHLYDRGRPMHRMQARSTDGGMTWEHGIAPHPASLEGDGEPCPGGIDFTHPDFAMKFLYDSTGAGSRSWFYVSTDRCRSWAGPWRIPNMGLYGLSSRTDYKVVDSSTAMAFLTAAQADGPQGPVYAARITDGGASWELLPRIGRSHPRFFTIMPASVRLGEGRYLAALRCANEVEEVRAHFIDLYATDDDCRTWRYVGRPAENVGRGNPPAMIRLRDGRIAITFGDRRGPYCIRARVSEDDGQTWGPDIVLRDDGGDADIGYTRTVQRTDGRIVTAYYFNRDHHGERVINATIWHPDEDA